jgi:hypothetical protein
VEERFLGRILKYDPTNQILILKADFIDLEKQKTLELIFQEQKSFSFCFKKPYKKEKTWEQLKKYYKTLHTILNKLDIYPDADIVSAFDTEVKKQALSCKELIIYDKSVPLIPSKADMSSEELSYLIQYLYNTYGELLDEEGQNSYD